MCLNPRCFISVRYEFSELHLILTWAQRGHCALYDRWMSVVRRQRFDQIPTQSRIKRVIMILARPFSMIAQMVPV